MLLKVSLTLILGLLVTQKAHTQNACRDYFDEITVFSVQPFGLKHSTEYPDFKLERTPMQIYALEVEARSILAQLQSPGILPRVGARKPQFPALTRYKNLVELNGPFTQVETHANLDQRIRSQISELVDLLKNLNEKDRETLRTYMDRANANLESFKEELKVYEDLAYRLDFIYEEAQTLHKVSKPIYDSYRSGNLRALLLFKRYLPYLEAHVKQSSSLWQFNTSAKVDPKLLGLNQFSVQISGSLETRVIRDTPSQNDPRQERYSKSWEPSQRSPAPERVLPANHPEVVRQRYSQSPTYTLPPVSTAKAETIAPTLRYEVQLSIKATRIPGVPAYRNAIVDYRNWATKNKLDDAIHFAHGGTANTPMIVTLTDRAPLGTFEKFQAAYLDQIASVKDLGTAKTVSYHNLRIREHDAKGNKRSPEEISRRVEEWLSLNGLSKSEVEIRFTPGSKDSIVQLHIFSNRTDKILQKIAADFSWLQPTLEKTTQVISPFVEREDVNYP